MIAQAKTCWFIIQNQERVVINHDNSFPNHQDILPLSPYFVRDFSLGHVNGVDYFCAEIRDDITIEDAFQTVSLKQALSMTHPAQYSMGVKAFTVILWDKNNQFCGRCAIPTIHQKPHFQRLCPGCQLSFFPRISPSVIVLIHHGNEVVMARSPHYALGIYGLIAGFVETGESIEETIHREIKEEIGLTVKNITYFGSQPWPFPDTLMLAFIAEYDSGQLIIDHDEIEEAGWYRYDNLPGRPSSSFSIASRLLDHFIRTCEEKETYRDR